MAHESRGSRKYVPPRHAGRGGGRRTGRGRRIMLFLIIELLHRQHNTFFTSRNTLSTNLITDICKDGLTVVASFHSFYEFGS
eukprot:scaffold1593_cov193-Alexandrium_tamarense.AAC.57